MRTRWSHKSIEVASTLNKYIMKETHTLVTIVIDLFIRSNDFSEFWSMAMPMTYSGKRGRKYLLSPYIIVTSECVLHMACWKNEYHQNITLIVRLIKKIINISNPCGFCCCCFCSWIPLIRIFVIRISYNIENKREKEKENAAFRWMVSG